MGRDNSKGGRKNLQKRGSGDSRSSALAVLDKVRREGMLANQALRNETSRRDLYHRDRQQTHERVLGVFRYRRLLDALIEEHSKRRPPKKDPRLMDILRLGMYELVFMDGIPAYATVDGYVRLIRKIKGAHVAGFVNAILRAAADLQYGEEYRQSRSSRVPHLCPDWIASEANEALKTGADEVLSWLARPAPISLRVHSGRRSREQIEEELAGTGLHPAAMPGLPDALFLPPGESPFATVAFAQGRFWPQDLSSQIVSALFAGTGTGRVLDACAGTGTKALDMVLRSQALHFLVCADLSHSRLEALQRRTSDAGLRLAGVVVSDLTEPPFAESCFDTVVVDAPCTGLGTLRRHPELMWMRTPEDVEQAAKRQEKLLHGAAALVRPGGLLCYAVCSFTRAEGPRAVTRFLKEHGEFQPLSTDELGQRVAVSLLSPLPSDPTTPGFLVGPPTVDGDLFYVCLMKRQ